MGSPLLYGGKKLVLVMYRTKSFIRMAVQQRRRGKNVPIGGWGVKPL
jgi:hypothetical protein